MEERGIKLVIKRKSDGLRATLYTNGVVDGNEYGFDAFITLKGIQLFDLPFKLSGNAGVTLFEFKVIREIGFAEIIGRYSFAYPTFFYYWEGEETVKSFAAGIGYGIGTLELNGDDVEFGLLGILLDDKEDIRTTTDIHSTTVQDIFFEIKYNGFPLYNKASVRIFNASDEAFEFELVDSKFTVGMFFKF